MPPRHPVTDVQQLLNAVELTQTPVADTKVASGGASSAAKGPSIHTLLLYDSGDSEISEFAPILARAYYPKAKLVGVSSLAELAAALSKYSSIDTLVIDVHSGPGYLLIGNGSPSTKSVRNALAKTGVAVKSKIVFEGCQIMQDPIDTCQMVEPICGSGTQVTGFTYFSISNTFTIDFTDFTDPAEIQSYYDGLTMEYMVPGLPSAQDSAGKVVKHGRRWFRSDFDNTLPENAPGARIKSLQDLQSYQIQNAQDALQAQADFAGPVVQGARVTVTNVAAVARANTQQSPTPVPANP